LFAAGSISYLDRAALAVAAPMLTRELHLDPARMGMVFSVFFLGYAPMSFIGGSAADRFGPWKVLLVTMTIWSLACGATATAFSLAALIVIRLIFGMGEGPFNATAVKMISRQFEPRKHAGAIGLAYAGQPLGAALAGPIVGVVALAYGWRTSFVVIAFLGLVWVCLWFRLASEPGSTGKAPRDEHATTTGTVTTKSLLKTLGTPSIIAICVAFFAYAYVLYFFMSWFPSYLVKQQHLTISAMAGVSTIPWVAGSIGLAVGGLVCDSLAALTKDALRAKKMMISLALLLTAACVGLAGAASGVTAAVALMTVGIFASYLTPSLYYAIVLHLVPDEMSGSVSGFINLAANAAGVVAPLTTGFILAWTGSFTAAFGLAAVVCVAGALAVLLFVNEKSRIEGASMVSIPSSAT
jgi:MFS family permease